jgi:hypothetical protein
MNFEEGHNFFFFISGHRRFWILIIFKLILGVRELGERSTPLEYTILIKKALRNQKLGSRNVCDFLGPPIVLSLVNFTELAE